MPTPPLRDPHRRRLLGFALVASLLTTDLAGPASAQTLAPLAVGTNGNVEDQTFNGGLFGYPSIDVGTYGGGGTLTVLSGGIGPSNPAVPGELPASIRIGFADDPDAGPSTGRAHVSGGISAGDVRVGASWNATGELTVGGDVILTNPDADAYSPYGGLYVGVNAFGGDARGDVSIDGDVHANLLVGRVDQSTSSAYSTIRSAIGNLAITGSVHATSVSVGAAFGSEPGPYDGTITIGGDLILDDPSSLILVTQRPLNLFGPSDVPTPPDPSGSIRVEGVTRFTGDTPQEPLFSSGPPAPPRRLYVSISDARSEAFGRFETEAIENADHILVGTNYQGFEGGGHRGELVVRSGGLSSDAIYVPTNLTAGFRDQGGGPGGVGHVDITGDVDIGGISANNDGTEVILRNGESIRNIDILLESPREWWRPERSGGARLELDRYALNDGRVFVSEEATLAMHVRGAEPGTGYSTIRSRRFPGTVDIGVGGTLEVILADVLPEGAYDLIVTRSLSFVDMEEQIQVVGLNPERARFEHIIEPISSRFSIHTLRMTIVPEPSTALLLGLGLASLARSRRRA